MKKAVRFNLQAVIRQISIFCTPLWMMVGVAGCQTYVPLPLKETRPPTADIEHIQIDRSKLDIPTLQNYPFNPADGLDITEVAILAVVRNPDLRLARADLNISEAQAFSAGLLPDPQISFAGDFPSPHQAGLTPAYNGGINFDLAALITHSNLSAAAREDAKKTELTLLWNEWQTIGQARQLFIRTLYLEKTRKLLERAFSAQEARAEHMEKAMKEGNSTRDVVTPFLASREDIRKQLSDVLRQQEQTRHDLNTLLGLAPQVHLDLVGPADIQTISEERLKNSLEHLAHRRPDLLALAAGYRSQDQKYRAAILAQFPALTLGFNRARDTSGITTLGFGVSLSLPVFNRNRGNIAVESASRERLHTEYEVRIAQANADVDRLAADQALAMQQLRKTQEVLPSLRENVAKAKEALRAGDLPIFGFVDLQAALLTKEVEAVSLEQSILEQNVALASLLGDESFVRFNRSSIGE